MNPHQNESRICAYETYMNHDAKLEHVVIDPILVRWGEYSFQVIIVRDTMQNQNGNEDNDCFFIEKFDEFFFLLLLKKKNLEF